MLDDVLEWLRGVDYLDARIASGVITIDIEASLCFLERCVRLTRMNHLVRGVQHDHKVRFRRSLDHPLGNTGRAMITVALQVKLNFKTVPVVHDQGCLRELSLSLQPVPQPHVQDVVAIGHHPEAEWSRCRTRREGWLAWAGSATAFHHSRDGAERRQYSLVEVHTHNALERHPRRRKSGDDLGDAGLANTVRAEDRDAKARRL